MGTHTNFSKDFEDQLDKAFGSGRGGFEQTAKKGRRAALGIGFTVALVALALTVAGIVLALTVSPWFWLAVILTGGYTVVSGIIILLMSSVTKDLI